MIGDEMCLPLQEFGVVDGYEMAEQALEKSTPGTRMWNLKDRGFWSFTVTHGAHVGEHINANCTRLE